MADPTLVIIRVCFLLTGRVGPAGVAGLTLGVSWRRLWPRCSGGPRVVVVVGWPRVWWEPVVLVEEGGRL